MEDNFTPAFFAGNRARLRQAVAAHDDARLIVVTANGLLQRNADSTFKFRQDSSFWYLTGIAEPDITLVMDGEVEFLILPERDVQREAFDGVVTAEMLTKRSGINDVEGTEEGWRRLGAQVKKSHRVATPEALPAYADRFGFYANPARAALASRIQQAKKSAELVDIREALMRLRAVKQPVELESIRQAIAVTGDALSFMTDRQRLLKYVYEYEIEADLAREFRRKGCGHAFDPIIAAGERGVQLHYLANNGKLLKDDLIVMDVGAESGQYAADITRTVAYGDPSERQRQVYDAVCAVQDFALGLLKPGAALIEYEKEVQQCMAEKLRELGLIKNADAEAVRKYYPHATSHFMGLDVHDTGDYREPLAEGMVLTCEPGIYIPEEGIGVRIEDDVLITKDGHTLLSEKIPRTLTP